ncbi:MAG: HPr kinase/phosphatase C-terminal domain-containing protein [Xanthobacteraceae bacterium]|nr:HPr kinase/phosphatase C-terminal domain-containing protein [Xanthobacteraceae bacterium]
MHKGSGSEHATAVLAGSHAVLIRGPSGSGKSKLAWDLLEAARAGKIHFARLVADDRAALSTVNGKLIVSAPKTIEGKIELRGSGIQSVEFEPFAAVGIVIDLAADDAGRMPAFETAQTEILGVRLPRVPVAKGSDPLPLVLQALGTKDGGG